MIVEKLTVIKNKKIQYAQSGCYDLSQILVHKARIVPDNPFAFPPTVEPLRVSFSISSLCSGHPWRSDVQVPWSTGRATTPGMEEVRAHGRAKVEQCRSNCREQRMEQLPRDLIPMNFKPIRKLQDSSEAPSHSLGTGLGMTNTINQRFLKGADAPPA